MKLKFSISYNTAWGEALYVIIDYRSLDGTARRYRLPMVTGDGSLWTLETAAVESRQHPVGSFCYSYQVEDTEGRVLRREWSRVPRVYHFDASKDYILSDAWRDIPLQHHLYTNAYLTATGGRRGEEVEPLRMPLFRRTLMFRVSAPQLRQGQALAVCGNHPALGDWNPSRYLKMQYAGMHEWMLTVNVSGMAMPLEYKYVIVDEQANAFIAWEEGDNRTTGSMEAGDGQVLVFNGGTLRVKEDTWLAAGVVIPVFALRSRHSYGVGDFGDLRRMVDWAVATGMKVIQTLPVNDTTTTHGWTDSYPYNTISVNALHPHYVDLEAAGILKSKEKMTAYYRQRSELNALSYSDYEAVGRVKAAYLHDLYAEKGKQVVSSAGYQQFAGANEWWLLPYAVFCSLREKYHTAHFPDWGELAVYSRQAAESYAEANKEEVLFVYFVQYLLHTQLKSAAEYARSHGIVLKGDVPIGICRDSVEAWMHPGYFHLDAQTGTPPDAFMPNGQNWGFPTCDWEAMMADGCRWWRSRFACMEQYFDAFRIDHVLGFFRIWEIPCGAVAGQLGHFSPALPLTVGEIEYCGLHFRRDLFTLPFANERVINRLFGIHAQYVRDHFLTEKAYQLYGLRPEYDTQEKVRAYFEGRNDENSLWIRDGLYRLLSNVLFVEDPRQPEMYHPRIGAYSETVFDVLSSEEKDAYMRLYHNYFHQRHNLYWGHQAMKRLPAVLHDTRMLVCAEDLGMLPDCVEPVLDALRILTLEIQSMPKQAGGEFAHLGANAYRSVATFSTHDMPPMRLWWEESRECAQRYYATILQKEGRAPEQLPAHLAEEIIARHLYCPSMLCLLSFQDWMAMDAELRAKNPRQERINIPSDHYNRWQYRMHLTIEDLLGAEKYNRKVKTMITRSRR